MTSSSEKGTSLKPEAAGSADHKCGTWWVRGQCPHSGDLGLRWSLTVKRRKDTGTLECIDSFLLCLLQSAPVVGIVMQSVCSPSYY